MASKKVNYDYLVNNDSNYSDFIVFTDLGGKPYKALDTLNTILSYFEKEKATTLLDMTTLNKGAVSIFKGENAFKYTGSAEGHLCLYCEELHIDSFLKLQYQTFLNYYSVTVHNYSLLGIPYEYAKRKYTSKSDMNNMTIRHIEGVACFSMCDFIFGVANKRSKKAVSSLIKRIKLCIECLKKNYVYYELKNKQ